MRRRFPFPLIVIPAVALFSLVLMLLWNALIPDIFRLGPITYWQALGLLVLAKILFGGWHGHHPGHHWRHHRIWREQWAAMSEEERAKFREEWRHRWCCTDAPPKE